MATGATKPPARKQESIKVDKFAIGAQTPVGSQTTIANATGGATVDAEARVAVNAVIARLKTFGIIL
jgi:hypothetical protein